MDDEMLELVARRTPKRRQAGRNAGRLWIGRRASHAAPHGLDYRNERLAHVPHLVDLAVAPLEVEAQHGNAPLVDAVRVDAAFSSGSRTGAA